MEKTIQNRKKANIAALLQYTILFCILVIGIYWVLIVSHKTFFQFQDGIKQTYFWTTETKHQLEMLLRGEGLQLWSWSKLLGMSIQTSRYWDPFNWIAAAFPVGYLELGTTIATLMRLYCGGLAFLALMRYTGLSVFASVFGAAAYTFCGYNIVTGLQHADMLMNIYLFPLLVMSVEMAYRGRSPAFFSLATGLYLVSNFYYSYMAAVSIIIFIILRYFAYNKFELTDFVKNTGRFVIYGVLGICVGSIQFIPDFDALSWASTESVKDKIGLLFGRSYYISFGEKILLGTGNIRNYMVMGWTLIIIMLLIVSLIGMRISNTPALISLIMIAGTLIPSVCSMYNGFSYPNRRWIFALELFAAWAAAAELDGSRLLKKPGVASAIAALGITAFLTLGMNYIFELDLGKSAVTFLTIHLIGGAAFAAVLLFSCRAGEFGKLSKTVTVVILCCTLTAAWTVSFNEGQSLLYRNNKINKILERSTQRAGALIEDDSFYRIDQVDSMFYSHSIKLPANEPLWWQTRPIYAYNSRIPSDFLEFNRILGNNYGYFKRVATLSNDNRTGLDYLYGVKYFLGDDKKYDRNGSDEYAGYGFSEYQNLDGVNVFRSKYDVSLGYVFDKYISESEFEKLGYAEREQALLQAAVLPDDRELPGVRQVKADDVRTSVKDIGYTITAGEGVTLNADSIVVSDADSVITLEPEDVENSQLLLSISGMLRNVEEGQSDPFELYVNNECVSETAKNSRSNQGIPGVKDYNLNLGYYDKYSNGKIEMSFSAPGVYYFDEIRLRAMDADLFDDCIGALSDRRYRIDAFSDTTVEGTIDSENDGVLFLSIIEPDRWDCYIDGEKAEIIKNTDIAFTGVYVPAGHHSIKLVFSNRMAKLGMIVSLAALVVLAVMNYWLSHRRFSKI